jgi:flagellin-like hook-associated protein FlgL
MASRQHYIDAQRSSHKSSVKISTSSRLEHSKDDTAAISQSAKMKSNILANKSYIKNLESARSYLKFQEAGYKKVFLIYQRMEELSSESLIQPKSSDSPLNNEFEELKKQLITIKNSKLNGISVFDPVATCGEIVDIPVEGSALDYTSKESGVLQTIRGKSVDVGAHGGTLSFNVNSGESGEIYRVFMGTRQIFSTGPSFTGDPTQVIINKTAGGTDPHEDSPSNPVLQSNITNSDSWQTSGWASNGDPDKIILNFGPGIETTYKITLGNSNNTESFNIGANAQEQLSVDGGKIRISNLGANSSETQLSIHVETKSIGVISDVEFIPKFFGKSIDIDHEGNQVELDAIGLETFANFSIESSRDARLTSNKLLGDGDIMGEVECLSANWLPKIAASINRIDSELDDAESKSFNQEIALGRIVDSDMALEVTNHAKQILKMDMAAFVMNKTTRMNDILTPLTTQHHRSAIMNGSALL